MSGWHRPDGALRVGDDPVVLRPEDAGWSFVGLRVLVVPAGGARTVFTGNSEAFVLPLAGAVSVVVDGVRFELAGRRSVFTRVSDFAYVPRDAEVVVGAEREAVVALASARCERRLVARYGPAEGVPVEVRGAGSATRQVNNFGVPGVWGMRIG